MTNERYMTARQVYERYGIPRGVLQNLVDSGKIRVDVIENDGFKLKRYYADEIRAIGEEVGQ